MKKTLLAFIFAAAATGAMAQAPTIGNELIPVVGQTKVIYLADSVGIEPGAMGTNVTWDFSNLKRSANKDSLISEILSPSKTPYASDYPDATAAGMSVSGSSYSYYNTDNNKVEVVGIVSQAQGFTLKNKYTNTLISYTTPITYNYNFSDDFAASYTVQGMTVYRYGTSEVMADGYGTLKIGSKTFNDVLRMHNISHETDSMNISGMVQLQYIDLESYVYATPGKKDPILTISYTKTRSGAQTLGSKTVTYNTDVTATGTEEFKNNDVSLNIYPNPASANCHITLNAKEDMRANIQLVNQLGQVIKTVADYNCHSGSNNINFDLSSLAKGIYFVKIQANNTFSSQKLIVE